MSGVRAPHWAPLNSPFTLTPPPHCAAAPIQLPQMRPAASPSAPLKVDPLLGKPPCMIALGLATKLCLRSCHRGSCGNPLGLHDLMVVISNKSWLKLSFAAVVVLNKKSNVPFLIHKILQ
ncbi:hypothetical protein O181_096736 [Austropuccinia psidii MF-1]|uniref:Uncharacterized protein n=1 Tax=Austropuccinia psidii MF-1 TaxID=1389203 RepID=A0A9Q3J7M5_9BASI|nr:hypothetical protein [Austropuccinia psidii MF-1]